jgi:hypothetical protein
VLDRQILDASAIHKDNLFRPSRPADPSFTEKPTNGDSLHRCGLDLDNLLHNLVTSEIRDAGRQ